MKRIFNLFRKAYVWSLTVSLLLVGTASYVLLDTFVIPKALATTQTRKQTVTTKTGTTSATEAESTTNSSASASRTAVSKTATSYTSENIKIKISTKRSQDTTFYVADIQINDVNYLKTALAQNTYGRNIKETTSAMATANNAILAVNGDYYGFRDDGYVLRNGTLYRKTAANETDALVVGSDGNLSVVNQSQTTAEKLLKEGATQVLSFGPTLVANSQIVVSQDAEVGQAMASNPRTAIGQISKGHYVIIVADGRTSESTGLSLYQLAAEFKTLGATLAYNLDGGGSSTMVFNGQVVNNPTQGGGNGERSVSDIIYIGA